ncbi:ABC transporter permease [Kribbia dieselivorans]|uniref:ABC transporter permease n=1 Tax=Kribbia dieselivorans TaxID=331526 RepID=UPI0009FA73EB|nr:iron chelate uptake ABC transporter family permease subunit [Kribbia dieselivorans]
MSVSAPARTPATTGRAPRRAWLIVAIVGLVLLTAASVMVGVADQDWQILTTSRLPRTAAVMLAGASLAVAGLIMQLLTRNPFVEPATAGTMEFAGLGLVLVMLTLPGAPIWLRMLAGTAAALAGSAVFLRLISRLSRGDILGVPLVGLVLGGVVGAASTFLAYRNDLVQSLNAWLTGDFSAVISGRYELLWLSGVATVVAVVVADRFTIASLGHEVATNLGLDHRRAMALGMTIVSVISASTVVTVGMLPFIGLVVPNLVTRIVGGHARRALPWVLVLGAGATLLCDLVARTLRYPYELPIGLVVGVAGGLVFLVMLLRGFDRAH